MIPAPRDRAPPAPFRRGGYTPIMASKGWRLHRGIELSPLMLGRLTDSDHLRNLLILLLKFGLASLGGVAFRKDTAWDATAERSASSSIDGGGGQGPLRVTTQSDAGSRSSPSSSPRNSATEGHRNAAGPRLEAAGFASAIVSVSPCSFHGRRLRGSPQGASWRYRRAAATDTASPHSSSARRTRGRSERGPEQPCTDRTARQDRSL